MSAGSSARRRGKKKTSLADELAALTNPTPNAFDGADDDEYGDGTNTYARQMAAAAEEAADDADDDGRGGAPAVAGLPMRSSAGGDAFESSAKYRGQTVTREQLLREMQELSPSDSDSDDSDSDDDAADSDDDASGAPDADNGGGGDDDDSSDDENAKPFGPATGGDGRDSSSRAAEGEDGAGAAAGGAASSAALAGADAIQHQLDQLEQEDAMTLVDRRAHQRNEMERAQHTRNQKALWGQLFGVRMQLQTLTGMANRLPSAGPAFRAFTQGVVADSDSDDAGEGAGGAAAPGAAATGKAGKLAREVAAGLETGRGHLTAVLHDLLAVADHLVGRGTQGGGGGGGGGSDGDKRTKTRRQRGHGGSGRGRAGGSDSGSDDSGSDSDGGSGSDGDAADASRPGAATAGPATTDALWVRVDKNFKDLLPRVFAVCNQENRREQLVGGAAFNQSAGGKQQFQAFNQTVEKQVADVLEMNRARLLARARKRRADAKPIGSGLQRAGGGDDGAASDEDPEIFDDFDFYTAQLEKVMVEGGAFGEGNSEVEAAVMSGAGGLAGLKRFRKKKTAKSLARDRKASKGRKIRFKVHPKLLNFMAPAAYPESHLDQDKLFASLFKAR